MLLIYDANCVTARLSGRMTPAWIDGLDELLSCYEPGYWHTWAYQHGRSDGKNRFLIRAPLTIPAGLGPRVESHCMAQGVPLDIQDERPGPPWAPGTPVPDDLHGVTLAPDQVSAVQDLLRFGKGCAILPTNFGKTECAAALFRAAGLAKGLMLVDRRSLLIQTAERLQLRLGEKIGRIGAGYRDVSRRVTVATIQGLHAKLGVYSRNLFPSQKLVIVDECHVIAHMGLAVLERIHAPARFGLSATIRESDRRLFIEAQLGPVILERELTELMETGRAAFPDIFMVRVGGIFAETMAFADLYEFAIIHHQARNDLICQAARREVERGQQTVVLVWSIPHGEILQRALSSRFAYVPFLHGKTPLDAVERAKQKFTAGEYRVMIASSIFDFGQDIPAINTLILGTGMHSALRTIQRLGRALRRKPQGENRARIIDFFDMGSGMLTRQSTSRARTYAKKGFPAQIVGNLDEIA